jgi:phage gpG-like protein
VDALQKQAAKNRTKSTTGQPVLTAPKPNPMLMPEEFIKNTLTDLEKEILASIAENFRTQSFFGQSWQSRKSGGSRKILHGQGTLENSFMGSNDGKSSITITSSVPYAAIHNEGGEITVTANMKKYFWAMHFRASAAAEKQYYKSLALMKTGSKITIPKRPFLGAHPAMDSLVQSVVDANVQELADSIFENLKKQFP